MASHRSRGRPGWLLTEVLEGVCVGCRNRPGAAPEPLVDATACRSPSWRSGIIRYTEQTICQLGGRATSYSGPSTGGILMSRWKVPKGFKVIAGGNTYINTPNIITYRGESLFELKRSDRDGYLGISFDVLGETGEKLETVRNGQFVGETPAGYSLDAKHDHFTLTEDATGRIICDLRLRENAAEDAEIEVSAKMYMPNGFLLELSPSETNVGGTRLIGNTFENCGAGIAVR